MMPFLPPPPPAYVLQVQAPGFMMVPRSGAGGSYGGGYQDVPTGMPEAPGGYHGQPWLEPPAADAPQVLPSPVAPAPAPVARKPSWILAIPVEAVSSKTVWGRESAWSRQWVAPVRRDGMRIVSIMGDADDRARLTEGMLSQPDDSSTAQAALALARKYGAPAVAVLRANGEGTAVWLWRGGSDPVETDSDAIGDSAKESALDMLVDLADPGHSNAPTASAATVQPAVAAAAKADSGPPTGGTGVDLETHPEFAQDGQYGFAIVLSSSDKLRSALLKHQVAALHGVHVLTADVDQDGAIITGSYEGGQAELVAALGAAGVKATTADQDPDASQQ